MAEPAKITDLNLETDFANSDMFPFADVSAGFDKRISGADLSNVITKLQSISTPEAYGAVGDGTTDDTTAFQAAVNDTEFLFCENSYNIGSITIPDNTKIISTGTFNSASGAAQLFLIENVSNVELDGIKMTGGATNSIVIGIKIEGSNNVKVSNCVIDGVDVTVAGGVVRGVQVNGSTNVRVNNNEIKNIRGWGVRVSETNESVFIEENDINLTERAGIVVVKGNKHINILFNNLINTNSDFTVADGCIDIYGGDVYNENVNIIGNTVDGAALEVGSLSSLIRAKSTKNLNVKYNTFIDSDRVSFALLLESRDTLGIKDADISCNKFYISNDDYTGGIVRLKTCENINFHDNLLYSESTLTSPSVIFELRNDPLVNIHIINNLFYFPNTTKIGIQARGDEPVDGLTIQGNKIVVSSSDAINVDTGSDIFITDNFCEGHIVVVDSDVVKVSNNIVKRASPVITLTTNTNEQSTDNLLVDTS